jgi:L-lactate dehydrogenase complex protein LldG
MSGTTSSKKSILDSLHRNRPAAAELPALEHAWTTYADPRAKFIETLELIGGRAIIARDMNDLNTQLNQLPQVTSARRIASLVPSIDTANVDLASIDSPHALADIDVAVLAGQFGVAENAAVWVTDEHVQLRAIYFLCQHLVLVLPAHEIVHHLHAAYDRLAGLPWPRLSETRESASPVFGAFISGPSKTADIEQTLVIGAHGPRSLTVCLLENGTPSKCASDSV